MEKRPKGKKKIAASESFIKKLVQYYLRMKKVRPDEICIFNVVADHGRYQIRVGPDKNLEKNKKVRNPPGSRSIEIYGHMHNLFVDPQRNISPLPGHDEIKSNLKGSIIMKDIAVHIIDEEGHGTRIRLEKIPAGGVRENRSINLSGKEGPSQLEELRISGRLAHETYRIIQRDILKNLKMEK